MHAEVTAVVLEKSLVHGLGQVVCQLLIADGLRHQSPAAVPHPVPGQRLVYRFGPVAGQGMIEATLMSGAVSIRVPSRSNR